MTPKEQFFIDHKGHNVKTKPVFMRGKPVNLLETLKEKYLPDFLRKRWPVIFSEIKTDIRDHRCLDCGKGMAEGTPPEGVAPIRIQVDKPA